MHAVPRLALLVSCLWGNACTSLTSQDSQERQPMNTQTATCYYVCSQYGRLFPPNIRKNQMYKTGLHYINIFSCNSGCPPRVQRPPRRHRPQPGVPRHESRQICAAQRSEKFGRCQPTLCSIRHPTRQPQQVLLVAVSQPTGQPPQDIPRER